MVLARNPDWIGPRPDFDAVLEATCFGLGAPVSGIAAPGLTGKRGCDMTERDPESAWALLEEAGYGGGLSAAAARPVAGGRSAALPRRGTQSASRVE